MTESPVAVVASWVTLVASFALSFTTWLALGELAGYGGLAFAMALCVDGYIVTALVTWLSPVSERVARFARWNMYAAAAVGVLAQSAYHGASVYAATQVGWKAALATVVGALPPLFAALSVHLRGLVRHATGSPVVEVRDAIHVTQDTSLLPDLASAPPVEPAPAPEVASVVSRVRPLVSEGLGRNTIAERLGITPHQARQAIAEVKAEQRAPLHAVGGGR